MSDRNNDTDSAPLEERVTPEAVEPSDAEEPSEAAESSDAAGEGDGETGSPPAAAAGEVEAPGGDQEEEAEAGEAPQVSPEDEAALAAIEAELTEMLEADSTSDPYEELESARAELEAAKDQQLRLAADFDNYRRRMSSELADCSARAKAEVVARLLEAVDDLQRVSELDADTATVQSLVEGVDLVERKVLRALEEAGVEVLNPIGEPFDPSTMEAVMRVPLEEGGENDTVQQVMQKGYLLKGILVRPARVAVQMDD
jgi:molecular chaperone GrpE